MRYVTAVVASNATKNNSLRDAIEAINGTFDASEAYKEVKIANDQELDDNTFDIGVGNEENVWGRRNYMSQVPIHLIIL